MAGGRGERFWPLSREKRPKQLLKLLGKGTLLQQAANRLKKVVPPAHIFVITNSVQTPEVQKQLPWLPKENVIAEPVMRDTCAAVTLGAALVSAKDPDGVMAVLPSDHWIPDEARFVKILKDSFTIAEKLPVLVTIGIKPTEPATGYGYIRLGEELKELPPNFHPSTTFYKAEQFVEKPDYNRACEYLRAGNYRWNAGMFIWTANSLLDGLWKHKPEMAEACRRWIRAAQDGKLQQVLSRDYKKLEKISIDYALMEKADNVVCAEGDFAWDDLGSWTALARHLPTDEQGNTVQALYAQLDSQGNIIYDARSKKGGLIATLGVKDSMVILTDDALLVAPKSEAQRIRQLVQQISEKKRLRKFVVS